MKEQTTRIVLLEDDKKTITKEESIYPDGSKVIRLYYNFTSPINGEKINDICILEAIDDTIYYYDLQGSVIDVQNIPLKLLETVIDDDPLSTKTLSEIESIAHVNKKMITQYFGKICSLLSDISIVLNRGSRQYIFLLGDENILKIELDSPFYIYVSINDSDKNCKNIKNKIPFGVFLKDTLKNTNNLLEV